MISPYKKIYKTWLFKWIVYILKNPIIPDQVCEHKDVFSTFSYNEDIVIFEDLILWLKITNEFDSKEIQEYSINYLLDEDSSVNRKNNSLLYRYKFLKKHLLDILKFLTKVNDDCEKQH